MFGVHGNGLTHLIAMAPTAITTVIEIFYPGKALSPEHYRHTNKSLGWFKGGFARDYQWTAESLGIKHYGVWNDTYVMTYIPLPLESFRV